MNIFERSGLTTNYMWGAYYLVKDSKTYYLNYGTKDVYIFSYGLTFDEWSEIYLNVVCIEKLLPKENIGKAYFK
jgi:hypothetical protein